MTVALLGLATLLAAAVAVLHPADDPVAGDVDVVVVLGGGDGERLALGRALVDAHGGQLVLSSGAIEQGAAAGLSCDREVVCVEPWPVSTAGEARTTAGLADRHGWDRVVVATTRHHVTRTRELFGQCHDDVAVVGAPGRANPAVAVYRSARELVAIAAALTVARAC